MLMNRMQRACFLSLIASSSNSFYLTFDATRMMLKSKWGSRCKKMIRMAMWISRKWISQNRIRVDISASYILLYVNNQNQSDTESIPSMIYSRRQLETNSIEWNSRSWGKSRWGGSNEWKAKLRIFTRWNARCCWTEDEWSRIRCALMIESARAR